MYVLIDEAIKNIELALDSNAVRVTLEARAPSQNAQSNSAPSPSSQSNPAPGQTSQSNPAPGLLSTLTNMMTKGSSSSSTSKLPRPARVLKVDLLLFSGGRDANSDGLDLDVVDVEVSSWVKRVV